MHTSIQRVYQKIERDRLELLESIALISTDKYNFKPLPEKWSIGQILTHIVTSEKMSVQYMKKKALGIDKVKHSGVVEVIKLFILKVSQRLPFKYQAPKLVVANTPDVLPFNQLGEEWKNVRNDLKTFLDTLKEEDITKKIYKHPVVGRLNILQALQFFNEHVRHHHPQIKRLF